MMDEINRNFRIYAMTYLFKYLNIWVEKSRALVGDEETARALEQMAKGVRRHLPN